jgi:hypothetical protein
MNEFILSECQYLEEDYRHTHKRLVSVVCFTESVWLFVRPSVNYYPNFKISMCHYWLTSECDLILDQCQYS